MKGPRVFSWLMLAVWGSWIAALQGLLAARGGIGPWIPDFGIVFLIACASRFETADVPRAALVLGFTRIAYSIEPPTAVLAGFLGAAFVVLTVRAMAEVGGPRSRTVLAFVLAFAFSWWLMFVHRVTGAGDLGHEPALWGLRIASTTSLLALFFAPVLTRLPGLSPFQRPAW